MRHREKSLCHLFSMAQDILSGRIVVFVYAYINGVAKAQTEPVSAFGVSHHYLGCVPHRAS